MNARIYNSIFNHGAKIVGWENGSICLEYIYGTKYWYLNGKLHRTNGPAVEYVDGSKFWYFDGKRCTEERFNTLLKEKGLEIK